MSRKNNQRDEDSCWTNLLFSHKGTAPLTDMDTSSEVLPASGFYFHHSSRNARCDIYTPSFDSADSDKRRNFLPHTGEPISVNCDNELILFSPVEGEF